MIDRSRTAEGRSAKRLSTGMKIVGSKDDCSGYQISERIRVQLRGLDQNARNVRNGRSLADTALGAMQTQTEILKNIRVLTMKALDGTYGEKDCAAVQQEIDQMLEECGDIAHTANFNGIQLLDGADRIGSDTKLVGGSFGIIPQSGKIGVIGEPFSGLLLMASFDFGSYSAGWAGKTFNLSDKLTGVIDSSYIFTDGTTPVPSGYKAISIVDAGGNLLDKEDAMLRLMEAVSTSRIVAGCRTGAEDSGSSVGPLILQENRVEIIGAPGVDIMQDNSSIGWTFPYWNELPPRYEVDLNAYFLNNIDPLQNIAAQLDGKGFSVSLGSSTTAIKFVADPAEAGRYGDTYAIDLSGVKSASDLAKAIYGQTIPFMDLWGPGELCMGLTDKSGILTINTATEDYFIDNLVHDEGQMKISYTYGKNIAIQTGTRSNDYFNLTLCATTLDKLFENYGEATVNVQTQALVSAFLEELDGAIDYVLGASTVVGAQVMRMEFAEANITAAAENLTAAESVIRDADMAKEMTEKVKNGILTQASQAMLAQARHDSESVLELLH